MMISRRWLLWMIGGVAPSLQYELRKSASNRGMIKPKNQHRDDSIGRQLTSGNSNTSSNGTKHKKCKSSSKSPKSPKYSKAPSSKSDTNSPKRKLVEYQETLIEYKTQHTAERAIGNLRYQTQETIVVAPKSPVSLADDNYVKCKHPSSSPTLSLKPTVSRTPTSSPSDTPSDFPTSVPSDFPTDTPSSEPSESPTDIPSDSPTDTPSRQPSRDPSVSPTVSHFPSSTPSMNPSSFPSISHLPSLQPTESPSGLPSTSPSYMPSAKPSTVPSSGPSVSFAPSSGPSVSLVPSHVESVSFTQPYIYELEIPKGSDPSTPMRINIEKDIEKDIDTAVQHAFQPAFQQRYLMTVDIDSRKLNANCQKSDDYYCEVVQAECTLIVFSGRTSEQRTKLVLETISDTIELMDGDTYGVESIYFLGGGTVDGPYNPQSPERLKVESISPSAMLSSAGIFMVTAAGTLLALFIFAVSRKKRHYDIAVTEGILDDDSCVLDDDSLFGEDSSQLDLHPSKGSSDYTDGMSTTSSDLRLQAHVVGEDNSVFLLDPDGRLYGLGNSNQSTKVQHQGGMGIYSDNALNVHKCTSTTCPLCSKEQGPTFVASDAVEQAHIDNGQQLEEIEQRSYVVPDTVDI